MLPVLQGLKQSLDDCLTRQNVVPVGTTNTFTPMYGNVARKSTTAHSDKTIENSLLACGEQLI